MGRKHLDRTGEIYGRLTVISPAKNSKPYASNPYGHTRWNCKCDCETEITVRTTNLRSGNTKSCGCLHSEVVTERNTTHGLSRTKEYHAWKAARDRCLNPNNAYYKDYGGRGITMHPEWQESFEAFLEHIGPCPSPELSIDHINNDGHYEPGNLRWATRKQQRASQRPKRKKEDQ